MTSLTATEVPLVLAFDEPLPSGVEASELLGGKGANLAEMTRVLGLRVPPGFTITTSVCRAFLREGWPAQLDRALDVHLDRLAAQMGRTFGSAEAPLLVSVRSGAAVSMPGMMDTLLNVGMTPAVRDQLVTRSPLFAADTWLRFNRIYAEVVLGVPKAELAAAAAHDGTPAGMHEAAVRVRTLAESRGGIPGEPTEQLRGAIAAVFQSWLSDRAVAFRRREGIDDALGTAVTVQAMVFGNLGGRSGTGVAFTRDPATGAPGPYGDYLPDAQGEDVVAGDHAVSGIDVLRETVPEAYDELRQVLARLEHHYRDMCDVEFTVSEGILYILQTRIGRRSPLAAVRIAVDMAEDPVFPLSRAEAVARIDPSVLQRLAAGLGTIREEAQAFATGLPASPGIGVGVLCCDPDRAAEMSERGIAVVLAREETSPADIHGMVGAAALVTSLGGRASHAAVVARSWAIPAVTGAAGIAVRSHGIEVAGEFIAEGEVVTVDGAGGGIYAGDQRAGGPGQVDAATMIRAWAAELGIEPGAQAPPTDSAGRAADVTLYELARTVQLKGLCTPERAAAVLAAAETRVQQLVEANQTMFQATPRGVMLTPDGRAWTSEQFHAERAAVDLAALEAAYADFLDLNHRFKEVVSDWQRLAAGEPPPGAWDELVAVIGEIHVGLVPVLAKNSGQVQRLAGYGRRFQAALDAISAGDRSMLASPLKDSYHTVWFEYHEELIGLCGRDRATEGD